MVASARFEPDAVAAASFAVSRRGFDTDEVRTYLQGLAGELTRLRTECDDLRAQLAARPRDIHELDEGEVAQRLGEEAARVLTTAREAATQIRTRSEEAAAALVDEANQDAARTREHADVEAARVRHEAQLQAEAEIEAAKREGREMVAEARAVRERMLDDVRRRRDVAKAQLEQLRLGHERVLGTFELAADALASVMGDLRALVPDVRRNSAVETGPLPTVLPVGERDEPGDERGAADEAAAVQPAPPAVSISVPARAVMAAPMEEREGTVDEPAAGEDTTVDPHDEGPVEEPKPTVLVSAFSLGEAAAPEPEGETEVDVVAVTEEVETAARLDTVHVETNDELEPLDELETTDELDEADEPETTDEFDAADEPETTDELDAADEQEVAESPVDDGPPEEPAIDASVDLTELVLSPEADDADHADDAPEASAEQAVPADPEPAGESPHGGGPSQRPSADDLFARIRAAREAVTRDAVRATAVPVTAPVEEPAVTAEPEPVRASVLVAEVATDEVGAAVVAARDEALAPVEVALGRRLKRVLADEQNEVLDRLRRKNPVLALEALVGALDEHAAAYELAVRDEVGPAVTAGARSLRPELTDAEVASYTSGVADTVAGAVRDDAVAPLRERLARLLEGSPDAATVTDGVRTVYREWKTQRLDAAARHLAVAAHGHAAFAVLVPGTPVCWTIDPAHPCPDGEDNALGGPTPAGQAFPTGHRSAPAYVGCRCALAPAAR